MTQCAVGALASVRSAAAIQRDSADGLRDAITAALAVGVTWRAIGDALGIPHETAFRQYQAGSPIVVVRAYQRAKMEGNGSKPASG